MNKPLEAGEQMPRNRLLGVDTFRYILCYAVALLHALPGDAGHTKLVWATLLACVCRSAVPFFFVASGYFMARPSSSNASIVFRPLRRLLPVYVCWYLIYACIGEGRGFLSHLPSFRELVTGGSAFHLWFLPVLGASLAGVGVGVALVGLRATAVACIAIALSGLALGPYHSLLHLPLSGGGYRMSMGPALVLLGWCFKQRSTQVPLALALIFAALACVLVFTEEAVISYAENQSFTSHDAVLSTYLWGPAVFLVALALKKGAFIAKVSSLGSISLGVYASHLIFLRLFSQKLVENGFWESASVAIAATVMATMLSLILDRVPLLQRLVR